MPEKPLSLFPRIARRIHGAMRQMRYPKEFRIASVRRPDIAVGHLDWARLLALVSANGHGKTPPQEAVVESEGADFPEPAPLRSRGKPAVDNDGLPNAALAAVGTHLWRLRSRMLDPGGDGPLDEYRKLFRHVDAMCDTLAQEGLMIADHTGQPVPEGGVYGLRTIAFQPTPGIERETVIETIKPSVFFHDHTIQVGEVIIGVPEQEEAVSEDATEDPAVERSPEVAESPEAAEPSAADDRES